MSYLMYIFILYLLVPLFRQRICYRSFRLTPLSSHSALLCSTLIISLCISIRRAQNNAHVFYLTSPTSGLLAHVSYLLSSSTPGSSYNCNYKGYYNWNSREIETLSATINQTAIKRSVRKRITIVTNSVESGSSRSEPEEERTSLGRGAG